MRTWVAVLIVIAVVAAICLRWRAGRPALDSQDESGFAMQADSNQSRSLPQSLSSGEILIDQKDPEFVRRVLPVVREFFATLDRAGVNPIHSDLPYGSIRIHHGPNGIACRFLIGDSWSVSTYAGREFSGVMHFGQRGPDNPFRAISHADTNALARLSGRAIQMPKAEAERIIRPIAEINFRTRR